MGALLRDAIASPLRVVDDPYRADRYIAQYHGTEPARPEMRKPVTPRPALVVIAAVALAVALPGGFALVMLATNGFRVAGTPISDLGEVIALFGGSGVIIGWPITLLLWWLGRHSVLANIVGFLAFAAAAAIYPTFYAPGMQEQDGDIVNFTLLLLIFAVYGALSVSIALLTERIFHPRAALSADELSETCE